MELKKKRVETFVTSMKKCPARNFIEIEFSKIEDKYKLYSRMFTMVHDPEKISLLEAWIEIFFDIEKIKKYLTEEKMLFSILTVESHTGTKGSKESLLKGYPHIHLVVYKRSRGNLENFKDIHSFLRENTSFGKTGEDIRLDGETKKKGRSIAKSNISFLCYALKNSKHREPYVRLKFAYEDNKEKLEGIGITLDNCLFLDNSEDGEIINFFKEVCDKNIILNIPEDKLKITEIKEAMVTGSHSQNGTKKKSSGSDNFNNCTALIFEYMIMNDYALCDEQVYTRKKGTRRTWELWGTFEKFMGNFYNKENFKTGMVYELITNKTKLIDVATSVTQDILPKIDINWMYIEFVDFYLHLPSVSIIRGELPEDVNCGMYNGGVNFKIFEEGMRPEIWLSIIENQIFGKIEGEKSKFCNDFYRNLLPKIQKEGSLCLIGVSGCGKTTVIRPIIITIPKERQTEITEGTFCFSSIENKMMVRLDDVGKSILDAKNMKQLLEGDREIQSEGKFLGSRGVDFKGNVLICANDGELPDSWYNYDNMGNMTLKLEYDTRLAIYKFETRIKNPKPGFLKQIEQEEIGKVLLYCAGEFAKNTLCREEKLKIFETYDEGYTFMKNAEFVYV
tara:strand:+ start:1617 stop:3473 length:1857 start_codon:yes stop_codon:yes gene_type:complete